MYIIVTENKQILELAEKEQQQIIAINSFDFAISTQPAKVQEENITSISIRDEIADILFSVGIPPHLKGFNYLEYAIDFVLSSADLYQVGCAKVIYPEVAKHFNTNAHTVERNIRTALLHIPVRKVSGMLDEIYGLSPEKYSPTSKGFICAVAVYLKRKHNI